MTEPPDWDDEDWQPVGGVTRPDSPPPAQPPPLGERCPRCATVVPAGTATCPACLAPSGAGPRPRRLAGGVLRLVFRAGGGHLDVPRGGEVRLGRSGAWAPEASALLADEETVSARHATVVHTAEGAAWVTEVARGATNGTRVNDQVLVPGRPVRLRDGDRIELGPRACFEVRGVAREPAAD
ncbi:FHA domain-containing protein [Streptomyces achromogenes]|uniref:FHA domain-containing protein n=1 Tax=Streptomyces achromogenes TaxID=67255 RepID=UPI00369A3F5F